VKTPVDGWSPELLKGSVTNTPTAVIQAVSLEYVTTAADAVVDHKTTGRSKASDHFFI